MKILIATDAWEPQVCGVVRSLQALEIELVKLGHKVQFLTPKEFYKIPCPTYPEIPLSLARRSRVVQILKSGYDAVHISTEGPIGIATRAACLKLNVPFTTAYHTKFPEYVEARFKIPAKWTIHLMRWFHQPAKATMVATESLKRELEGLGFKNLQMWSRGVDLDLFSPLKRRSDLLIGKGPQLLYVGRVAVEKNIEAFLSLKVEGTKHIVGDGPQLTELKEKYPEAIFHGAQYGDRLAEFYASADVLVFPSLTDTFGLVLLESLASGTPVVAYPVTGPLDVIGLNGPAALTEDLADGISRALKIDRQSCVEFAAGYSWKNSCLQFLSNLFPTENLNRLEDRKTA